MKYLPYILIAILCCLLTYCATDHFRDTGNVIEVPKEVIKEKIIIQEKEVIKWKEAKSKIVYRTKFDTLATIDTVYAELKKCDTIVKVDSIIIAKQDTIIVGQKELIQNCENQLKSLNSKINKEKRKTLLTKIGAGIAIIITILLVK
jgi:hypothetical protein